MTQDADVLDSQLDWIGSTQRDISEGELQLRERRCDERRCP
jgi:hypothetical protein